jgi:hypothetical protein
MANSWSFSGSSAAPAASSWSLSAVAPPEENSGGSGPLGFVGNFVGDVKDAAVGLSALGGNILHDLGRGVAQVVPGHQSLGIINDTDPSGYHLDDIAKALPGVIASDYATRYGGASNIAHGLYEHPLSYLLDALMVGGVAGSVATKVGSAAVKGSEEALSAAGAAATELADAGAKTGSIIPAAVRKGLETLATERPLTGLEGLAQKILPKTKYATYGSDVVDLKLAAASPNPVTRALMKPLEKFGSQDIKLLTDQADELRAAIGNEERVSQVLAENKMATKASPELQVIQNADGTTTLSGWHAPREGAGVPAADTELGFGGFHFGTREAADARFAENARYGAGEPIPVATRGRFLGVDVPLSEADNTILAAGNFEEAASSGLLDGFMDLSPDPRDPSTWVDELTPNHIQGLSPQMRQLIDEVGPRGDLKAALQAKGYDGIIYTNEVEHPGSLSAMTFDTAKVRPAATTVLEKSHYQRSLRSWKTSRVRSRS